MELDKIITIRISTPLSFPLFILIYGIATCDYTRYFKRAHTEGSFTNVCTVTCKQVLVVFSTFSTNY